MQICATIKADAYGHSAKLVGQILVAAGVSWFCFYNLDEAIARLPDLSADANRADLRVLVLSPCILSPQHEDLLLSDAAKIRALASGHLRLTLVDPPSATALDRRVASASTPMPVHIQFDAGLTRAGATEAETLALIRHIQTLKHLRLEGLFAHFSHGDEPGHSATADQLAAFKACAAKARALCPSLLLHLQNSGGAFHVGDPVLQMARVGIALYGLQPSMDHPIPDLRPVARLVAPILAIHERPAGVGVGYGHTFTTQRPSRLGIVPVGYADGYPPRPQQPRRDAGARHPGAGRRPGQHGPNYYRYK